jgi:hypothetical protein
MEKSDNVKENRLLTGRIFGGVLAPYGVEAIEL